MSVSSRTAVAVHALTFLAQWEADDLQPSTDIAESLESNPVLVRRVLGLLRDKGLVSAVEGSGGGWQLAKPAEQITLRDAYAAVEKGAPVLPAHAHPPSQSCVIGRHMQSLLEVEFAAAQRAMEDRLAETSVAHMLRRIRDRERGEPVSR
ncbi:BadM/Rrf2 family transcriptional regulator [Haloactinopolyspora alba]|uniref:BadM/Rrf2 family transcriptional regulator n=1 Tax=Haloactinopolyspora alba TaxID=648780 RepID=A0A2P8EF34_9ACTN|nr:Rrf2 family transcriptional regulator [Haloactinopolyspora alba]PSL08078.1 BadM/Rrf2 family transcriptional regulator [Haloactinopolyspora alba]